MELLVTIQAKESTLALVNRGGKDRTVKFALRMNVLNISHAKMVELARDLKVTNTNVFVQLDSKENIVKSELRHVPITHVKMGQPVQTMRISWVEAS
jgi:hypothetical protein